MIIIVIVIIIIEEKRREENYFERHVSHGVKCETFFWMATKVAETFSIQVLFDQVTRVEINSTTLLTISTAIVGN